MNVVICSNFGLRLCMLLENKHISELNTNDVSFSPPHLLSYEKVTSFLSVLSLFNKHIWVI